MAQLSILAEMFRKQQAPPTARGPRSSLRQRTNRGFTRGAMGSYGSKFFRGRNSDAGVQRELSVLQSPVFKEFARRFSPRTPITDYFKGRAQ